LNTTTKKNTHKTGKKGEEIIMEFLQKRGYTILETNWRWKKKEIDIIALGPRNELIFAEVKTRSYFFMNGPAFSVTLKKQKNIIDAAHHYILQKNLNPPHIRFDVIALIKQNRSMEIKHIENAFYPV